MALLPNPATSKETSILKSGKTYYLMPASSGQAAVWVTKVGSGTALYPVDVNGTVTSSRPLYANQAAYQTAYDKAKAATTTTAPKTTTTAPKTTTTTTTPSAPATPTVASNFTLPNPNTATASSYISNGIQFVPVPGRYSDVTAPANQGKAPTQAPGSWVALIPGQEAKGYYAVNLDGSGKPTISSTVAFATSSALNQAKQQSQQTAEAAKAWVDPTLKAAQAAGFQDVASYQSALKASNAAGFGNDIAKHQIYLKAEEARRQAEAQRQAELKAQAEAKARADAEAAAAKAAEAKRLEQEQIAKAQAEYEAAEAKRREAEALAQRQAAQKAQTLELENKLMSAKTQGELDAVKAQASEAGITLNQGKLDRAQTIVQQNIQAAEQQRIQAVTQQYQTQLREAKTQEEFDRTLAQGKAAGAKLDDTQTQALQTNLTRSIDLIRQQTLDANRQAYEAKLGPEGLITTKEGLDEVLAQAKAAGVTISQGVIDKANARIAQEADRQAAIAKLSEDFAKGHSVPTTNVTNFYDQKLGEITGVPDDPITGTKGGFYIISGGGFQRINEDGTLGAVIPKDQFNQDLQTTRQNLITNQQQQEQQSKAAKLAEDVKRFESELPQPGTEQWNYLLANRFPVTGPDGRIYEPVAQNLSTGEAPKWIVSTSTSPQTAIGDQETYTELGKPDQVFTKGDINQVFIKNAEIIDAQQKAERAALIERQKAEANDYGPFDDMLYIALAAVAIGAVAGSISSAIGTAAETAVGAAEAGATASEALSTASTLAEAGSTASEISSVLESIYNIPSTIAETVSGIASDLASGFLPAGEVAASSGVTADMLAIANATADPIAAMNALAGWTSADMAYLASIGMPASVMAAAATTNAAIGAPTTVAEWAAATGTEVAGTGLATTPVSAPVAPGVGTGELVSTGISDMAPGTVFQGPGGPEIVLNSGKTVSLAQYEAALASGELVTVDGVLTSGALAPAPVTPSLPIGITEAEFLAADAAQMGAQGLSQAAIEQNLVFAGVDPFVAADAAALAASGVGEAAIAQNIAQSAAGAPIYGPVTPPPVASVPGSQPTPAEVTPVEAPTPPEVTPIEPTPIEPTTPPATPTTAPAAPPASSGVSTVTEAQLAAADAAQLAQQGLSQAQIESTLLFSGVDPLVAADAAALAASGIGEAAIAQNIAQSGATTAGGAPQIFTTVPGGIAEPLPGYTGPPGSAPIYGTNTPAPIYDKSVPFDPNAPQPTLTEGLGNLGEAVLENVTPGNVLDALGAASLLGPVIAPPPQIKRPEYGPIPPTVFGEVGTVATPGVNPGYFTNVLPSYQTTSPVQSQFYYGYRPLQTGQYDPQAYARPPGMPAVPFGLREMYTPTDINQFLREFNAPRAPIAPQSLA